MLDCDIGLAGPKPHDAAVEPAAREARIEQQRSVDQRYHGTDILTESGERDRGSRQDSGIVASHFERSPSELRALPTIRLPIFAAIVIQQPATAECREGERLPVARIALDRLF